MQNKEFTDRVLKIRNDKGFSQKKISEISGINQGFLSEIEQGKAVPSSNFFLLFYEKFDVDLNWLLTGRGEAYIEKKTPRNTEELTPGERLKKCRKILNLTQDELGKKIKSSHSFICSVEKNKYSMGAEFLYELNYRLNVNVNWLLTGEGSMFLNISTNAVDPANTSNDSVSSNVKEIKVSELTPDELQLIRTLLTNPLILSLVKNKLKNTLSDDIRILETMENRPRLRSILGMAVNLSDEEMDEIYAHIQVYQHKANMKNDITSSSDNMPERKRA